MQLSFGFFFSVVQEKNIYEDSIQLGLLQTQQWIYEDFLFALAAKQKYLEE